MAAGVDLGGRIADAENVGMTDGASGCIDDDAPDAPSSSMVDAHADVVEEAEAVAGGG